MSSLLTLDQSITKYLYLDLPSNAVSNIIFVIAGWFIYLLPIVLLIMFFRSYKEKIVSMKIFAAAIIAWQGLSAVVGNILYNDYGFRDRPFADRGITELFFEQPEKAFPSDHSAVIAVAVLMLFLNKYPKLGYVFLIGGVLSSLARVMIGFHWFGDVVGGWLLGALIVGIFWVFDKPITKFFEQIVQTFSRKYGKKSYS